MILYNWVGNDSRIAMII